MVHGGPPCPHDIAMIGAFIMSLPAIGVMLHWFIGCCKKCCGMEEKDEGLRKPHVDTCSRHGECRRSSNTKVG